MNRICMTRGLKNKRYIQRSVPPSFPKEALKELSSLPPEVLSRLHTIKPRSVIRNELLAKLLEENPLPIHNTIPQSASLFRGTLVFVQLAFYRSGQPPFFMSSADLQTAINYAARAVIPIHAYASQYGLNRIRVSPNIIRFEVNLDGNTYSDDYWLSGWVSNIATHHNLTDSCVIVLADTTGPTNTDADPAQGVLGYHWVTADNVPYCFCNVFGQNLTVDDRQDIYADTLSHEIAEMVVDPAADYSNPEVCDGCSGNCGNRQDNFFDSNDRFIGGSNVVPPAFNYSFLTNGIIKAGFIGAQSCAIPGSDPKGVCSYAPPTVWSTAPLATIPNIVSVSGHYNNGDQRDTVVVSTSDGAIHDIFWKSGQQGIEGQEVLPVNFGPNNIVATSSFVNSDAHRHMVIVATRQGKIHEIFWKPDTPGIEGHDDLPVTFAPGTIAAVSGFYNKDEHRHIVIVGTTAGKIHEIFWKADTPGIEGEDDLPVTFTPGTISGVAGFYNGDEKRHIVVVATSAGKIHEIFWKADTPGIEGHDDLPVTFGPGSIRGVAAFYDANVKRHVVIVGTLYGQVYQVYWKADTVGIEVSSVIANFASGSSIVDPIHPVPVGSSVVGVGGFYSDDDQFEHAIAGTFDGRIFESFAPFGQAVA